MYMPCNCIIFESVSKIKLVENKNRICTCCDLLDDYKNLINNNKLDLINDIIKCNTINNGIDNKEE